MVILDRDGVINEDSDQHIKTPEEWRPIAGSLEAIARLNHGGYRVVVVSNQSGLGRKLMDIETLNRIHGKMHRMVQEVGGNIEAVFFSPEKDDQHPMRKPNPGMFRDLAGRLKIDLNGIPCVGDSWRDIQACQAVGAMPILVRTGKGLRTLQEKHDWSDILILDNLAAVADHLLQRID